MRMSLRQAAAAAEEEGGVLMEASKWREALTKLDEASKALDGYHEPLNKSRLEAKIGRCYVELREYGNSLGHFERQLEFAKDGEAGAERDEGKAVAHHNVGHALTLMGAHARALDRLDDATALLEDLDMPEQKGRTASLAGVIHQTNNRLEPALKRHQVDLDTSNKLMRKNEGPDGGPGTTGCVRARHNIGCCYLRLGKFGQARENFDGCVELLDGIPSVESIESLHKGQTRNFLLAKALYHGALSTGAELDAGASSRLDRAARLIPDAPIAIVENAALPDEHAVAWRGRPEDAILGALIQLALARYSLRVAKQFGLDRKDFGGVHVRLGNANRYAHVAKRKLDVISNTSVTVVTHAVDATRGYAQAIAGDLKAAAISFVDALGTLVDGENRGSFGGTGKGGDPTFGCDTDGPPDLVVFDDGYGVRVRSDHLTTLKYNATKNRGIMIRQGLGLGALYACASLGGGAPGDEDKAANTSGPSAKAVRGAFDLLRSAEECEDLASSSATFGQRGCCRQLMGSKKEAIADFERQLSQAQASEGADAGEFGGAKLQMSALRNIGDCNEAIGDTAIALKYAKAHMQMGGRETDRTVIADASKRLIAAYVAVANQYLLDEETEDRVRAHVVMPVERLRNLHPDQLDRMEEDPTWIAANAKNLAKIQLEKYREAVAYYVAPSEAAPPGPQAAV